LSEHGINWNDIHISKVLVMQMFVQYNIY